MSLKVIDIYQYLLIFYDTYIHNGLPLILVTVAITVMQVFVFRRFQTVHEIK